MHRTYQEKKRVTVAGSSPAGLAVNERSGAAYATDLANDRIIEITPRARTPRLIPAGDGPLSIALSRDGRTAYAAGQADGALSLIDLRKGVVTKKVPTGAGALSVTTDPASGRALVANRTDATVTVVDPHKGTVVKTVTTGANPNHVTTAHGWRTWSKSRVPAPRARMPCAASPSGADGPPPQPGPRRPDHVVRTT